MSLHTQLDTDLRTLLGEPALEPEPSDDPTAAGLEYLERNRAAWERWSPEYSVVGRKAWQDDELRWGLWALPESALRLLDGMPPQTDVVELGCGTASVSAWLARMGHRPVAVDFARRQLEYARMLQTEFGIPFPLIHSAAEELHYDDGSFDVALSEYGASLWSDPRSWLPEAQRVLKPGGTLIFFINSALLMTCTPSDGGPAVDRLLRDYFSMYRVEFPSGAVEFHLPHGRWVRALRAYGFVLENLIEVCPPPDAEARFGFVSLDWGRRWPSEEIWIARKAS